MEGNDLRWPGYLGRSYKEGAGILCVGHYLREPTPELYRDKPVLEVADRRLVELTRRWKDDRRTPESDETYLRGVQNASKDAIQWWHSWRQQQFKLVVQDTLELRIEDVAWANFAKCRVPIENPDSQKYKILRLCRTRFPIHELVDAIRPVAVLVDKSRAVKLRSASPCYVRSCFTAQGRHQG